MKTRSVLRVVAIALTGLATVGPPDASADKVKVEDFYGIGFFETRVVTVDEVISDCGDADPSTNITRRTRTGTVEYTGFMEGTGQVLTRTIRDRCVPGQDHTSFRVLHTLESLTVAGRTGAAVVEHVGRSETVAPGQFIQESTIRILCGTGKLKGVHGEGTVTGSATPTSAAAAYQLWVHFGHNHDVGFDFLCQDLGDDDSEN